MIKRNKIVDYILLRIEAHREQIIDLEKQDTPFAKFAIAVNKAMIHEDEEIVKHIYELESVQSN